MNESERQSATTVSLLKCEDYEHAMLENVIRKGLSGIGLAPGMLRGKRVLLKPNLLSASPPESAVVTHPEVFRAALRIVKEGGGRPVMVESPAFQPLGKVIEKSGYDRILKEEACEVADTADRRVLFYGRGTGYKRFELPEALFEADIVISLSKLKTHSLTHITGAVKNLFGLIHGLNKSRWHVKAPSAEAFAGFLLDLYAALLKGFDPPKTYIHIMDAIVGMEGEGPGRRGRPKKIGALLLGRDALAVDAVAVRLLRLDPEKVPTLVLGAKRNSGVTSMEHIDVKGGHPSDFDIRDFVSSKSRNRFDLGRWPTNTDFFKNLFVERPVPGSDRCSLCYQCMTICPGKAIGKSDGNRRIPSYDYGKCIRCYCCMEICPEAAIRLKRGRLQWLLEWR